MTGYQMSGYDETLLWKMDAVLQSVDFSEIELLSVDVFDTLVFRLCSRPSDIFLELGKLSLQKGWVRDDISPSMFQNIRQSAERKARSHNLKELGTSEVTLREIYEMMPEGTGQLEMIQQAELDLEKKFCYINPYVASLLKYCKEKGLRIALVSDMYLGSTDIEDILVINEFPAHLIDRIFVSNEYRTNKESGGLFDVLSEAFPDIPREQILHIGDNIHADMEGAVKSGVRALHYPVIPQKMINVYERERVRYGTILSGLHSLRKLATNAVCFTGDELKADERFWFDIGAGILGPFFTLFSEWVVDTAVREQRQTILPFMREGKLLGELIQRTAENRGYDFRIVPIFISRQASYLASIGQFTEEQLGQLFERNHLSVENLFHLLKLDHYLDRFGDYRDVDVSESSQVNTKSGTDLKTALTEYLLQPVILEEMYLQIREERERLLLYLAQQAGDDHRYITVDLGFKGTIQGFIENAYANHGMKADLIHLVALGSELTRELIMSGADIRGWVGNAGENGNLIRKIMRSPEIIEQLILDTCGSTIGYDKDDSGRIVPILGSPLFSREEAGWKAWCQKGILHFQQLWFQLCRQKPFVKDQLLQQRKDWAYLLLRLIELPTFEEAQKLGQLHHDDNFGSSHYAPICRIQDEKQLHETGVDSFLTRSSYGFHVTKVYWPEGVVTRVYPGYLFLRSLARSEENNYLVLMHHVIQLIESNQHPSIIVYGAGEVGQAMLEVAALAGIKVECIVDRKESLWGSLWNGIPIVSLKQAIARDCHVYAVASLSFARDIKNDIEKAYENLGIKPIIYTPV